MVMMKQKTSEVIVRRFLLRLLISHRHGIGRKLKALCLLAFMLLAFNLLPLPLSGAQETGPSDQKVFAILKQKCSQCHGAAVQMSGLDLRTREAILNGGESGPAIVPGNAEASRLYRRIAGLEKPAMPMAPLPLLTAQEVAAVKSWIEQGAQWSASNDAKPGDAKPGDAKPGDARPGDAKPGNAKPATVAQEKAITNEDRSWW